MQICTLFAGRLTQCILSLVDHQSYYNSMEWSPGRLGEVPLSNDANYDTLGTTSST